MKLLIVEDEVLLSKSLSKGLRRLGYAVDCAFDGEEALELLEDVYKRQPLRRPPESSPLQSPRPAGKSRAG